jgi:hypothetical protein
MSLELSVPCNGCTRCCQGDALRLLPEDDASQYQTVPHWLNPAELMLDHKSNGDCIYLTDTGCGIHDRRPRMCRELDCRILAMQLTYTKARKMHILTVWARGKELLREGAAEALA